MPRADEIWTGGTKLTMEPTILLVETRAVQSGKIATIGRSADVENLTGPGTTVC